MRKTNTHIIRAAIMTASLTALAFQSACGSQRTAELSTSEQMLILEEIGIESTLVGYEEAMSPETGPSLIAGDWLAFQCAHAGGYFDRYDWSPTYANVVSSDFE